MEYLVHEDGAVALGPHDDADVGARVQEQRLAVVLPRPHAVQVQDEADEQRPPRLAIAVVAKGRRPRRLRQACMTGG